MSDVQQNPPKLDHIAPRWFHIWVEQLMAWLTDHRPVPGLGVTATDAPGGGVLLNADVASSAGVPVQFWKDGILVIQDMQTGAPSTDVGGAPLPSPEDFADSETGEVLIDSETGETFTT